jgi:hypothetical protein
MQQLTSCEPIILQLLQEEDGNLPKWYDQRSRSLLAQQIRHFSDRFSPRAVHPLRNVNRVISLRI